MSSEQRRVMVLDDDADLRTMLCDVFLRLGAADCIALPSVSSLEAAPRALETDLALLDVNLGDGEPNGVDAFQWLRDHQYQGKIVFLTGHAHSFPPVALAAKQEAAQILQKPTSIDVLEKILLECNHGTENRPAP